MRPRSTFALLGRCGLAVSALFIASNAAQAGNGSQPSKTAVNTPPYLQIDLRDLGYRPQQEYHYPGSGIPRDLSVLFDDYNLRLTFIDEKTSAVYQSHYPAPSETNPVPSRSMEGFFVNTKSGALISRKTWSTSKRKWLNERWDTQARILAVEKGFVVHAGNSLALYSGDLSKRANLQLDDHLSWAATVAPMGRTIHLEQIDRERSDGMANGEWLDSSDLTKLWEQQELAGVVSSSDCATVDKLADCLQLQVVGESPRNLYCLEPCRRGLPEVLSENEVLAEYYEGFCVLAINGERLWGRETTKDKNRLIIENHKRSLDGNRFVISVRGEHHTVFDEIKVGNRHLEILVYDSATRSQIFQLDLGTPVERIDFDLSPDGSVLAVLQGKVVRFYRIP